MVYDSEVECELARRLDERGAVEFFVKLPAWFTVDILVGEYNPDGAIVKHEDEMVYLIKETRRHEGFLETPHDGADQGALWPKILCGTSVPRAVAMTADEV